MLMKTPQVISFSVNFEDVTNILITAKIVRFYIVSNNSPVCG